MPAEQQNRIETIDALRGVASLAVVWFHFSNSQGLDSESVRRSGAYGWLGVHIFFVISAFVIPLALSRTEYQLKNYGRFLLKRLLRLEPPYIASIAIIIALALLAPLVPGYRGEPFNVSPLQLLSYVGYINVFTGWPWLNIVFWSLAIEFQFYLSIGLLFPLLITRRAYVRWGVLASLGALSFALPFDAFIFHYLFLFILGILTFQRHVGKVSGACYWLGFALCFVGVVLTLGYAVAIAGALTALAILFVRVRGRVLKFFGMISYSLYLIHFPVGQKVINLGFRFTQTSAGKITVLILTVGLCTLAAYLLYRFVERPAQRWSAAVRIKRVTELDRSAL